MKKVSNNRPVRCLVCNGQMYYSGNDNWVPEYTVDTFNSTDRHDNARFYVHADCWHTLLSQLKKGGIV